MNQDQIQGRMIYACRLLESTEQEKTGDVQALDDWYTQVALNGLCGGWVEIYKKDPVWLEGIWKCLERWTPKGDCKNAGSRERVQPEDLGSLQALLHAEGFEGAGREIRHVVRALTTAWEIMDTLEPGADYGQAPQWLKRAAGASGFTGALKLTEIYAAEPDIQPEDSAKWFTDTLFAKTGILDDEKADAHYLAHLETKYHHMCVRLHRHAGILTVMVCETEEAGIVKCSTRDDVLAVLKPGCAVGYDQSDEGSDGEAKGSTSAPSSDFSIKLFSVDV